MRSRDVEPLAANTCHGRRSVLTIPRVVPTWSSGLAQPQRVFLFDAHEHVDGSDAAFGVAEDHVGSLAHYVSARGRHN